MRDQTITITKSEYFNLLTEARSAEYVYGIIHHVAYSKQSDPGAREFALNLLDEWTK